MTENKNCGTEAFKWNVECGDLDKDWEMGILFRMGKVMLE